MEESTDTARGAGQPTARDRADRPDWHAIAASPEFVALEATRRRMMLTLLGVFVVAVGVFLVLCGYARPFMRRSVDGGLTVAYVWLLALTVLAWILVWLYLRFAERRLQPEAARLAERMGAERTGAEMGTKRG